MLTDPWGTKATVATYDPEARMVGLSYFDKRPAIFSHPLATLVDAANGRLRTDPAEQFTVSFETPIGIKVTLHF